MTALSDDELAAAIAQRAGELLLEVRATAQSEGVDDKTTRSRGDLTSNELILAELARERPDDAVLSEESKDDPIRLAAERVWIVDPLDGTREFAEFGRPDWAVHVALVVAGTPVAAAVALPALGEVLSTANPPSLAPAHAGAVRLVVSRTRPPKVTEFLASTMTAELVPMGSAGAKTMAVVRGEADVYAHGGGQYEWDSAAPVGVAAAAGLHVSRLDGSPLVYNQPDPYLPDLLVCRPELAETVLAALAAAPPDTAD
ncbi:MAG TPA: 3'(2'),5'-bisphosphate nucleotidase CysQ [Acidimicrobiia bacterium]|nr:3'(2'),5'-bisphosphate nucleotidase CysQ [Acidimicrobiia bacterium]